MANKPMSLYPGLTREVDEAPYDETTVAFFDFDRTLIAGYSVVGFVREAAVSGLLRPGRVLEMMRSGRARQSGFGAMLARVIEGLAGEQEALLIELGERVFARYTAPRIYPEARALITAHRRRGHRIVIVTSATPYQVYAVARTLAIEHVLCTRPEVDEDGIFTGHYQPPGCWNEGKRIHAEAWLARHGGSAADAWFYSDSSQDLPLLEHVGRARAVNPSERLERVALKKGWPVLRFGARRRSRSAAAGANLYGSLAAGATTFTLGGRLRDAVHVASTALGPVLGGLRLRVSGDQHLRTARPAVVVFNHQGAVDALVLARLLRRNFIPVCRRELGDDPLFGGVLRTTGAIYLDDAAATRAPGQLAPAQEALRDGRSVVVVPPEAGGGVSSAAPFHRGAFFLAKREGVPLLPLVIQDVAGALARHAPPWRRGTVDISVLPPVRPVHGGLRPTIEQLRTLERDYREALGDSADDRIDTPPLLRWQRSPRLAR